MEALRNEIVQGRKVFFILPTNPLLRRTLWKNILIRRMNVTLLTTI